ncbi:SulA-like leucine-rich domain-containing protein [Thaumasiovibrio subtropicus]|uniref:SulA-like leucine-rich domain-containing protein n=1 Tax=Thaumasiovibrio subtropicus TaxID=1891207 RepID=UPI000B35C1BC|nr:SulA-like leucine-rich domain-containing protein [Thaumasiovibrio subtropicus]
MEQINFNTLHNRYFTDASSFKTRSTAGLQFDVQDKGSFGFAMLLKTLKSLSQQDKWLLFIGGDSVVDRKVLKAAGVDVRKIRVARPKNPHQAQQFIEEAAKHSHYAAVICNVNLADVSQVCESQPLLKVNFSQRAVH